MEPLEIREAKKLIDKIGWWIPFPKIRSLVRDLLFTPYRCEYIERILIDDNSMAIVDLIMVHLGCPEKYKFILLDIKENDTCIDCGANAGLFTRLVNAQKGICYSFEPNKSLYNHLLKRYRDIDSIHIYNKAVSNKNDIVKFYKSSNDYIGNIGYSISYDNYGDTFEEVESIKLTQFIKEIF